MTSPSDAATQPVSYPRLAARTRHFQLGRPRAITVASDGHRVAFLRSRGGEDPVNCLWVLDLPAGTERLVADPVALLGADDEELPPQERARRERLRETTAGVTAFATDDAMRTAVFALSGRLFRADLESGRVSELPAAGAVIDPRPSPDGRRVAYVADGALHVVDDDGSSLRLVGEEGVTWGLAEFVAAEEMGRYRGFWWAPEGDRLLVARVDESPVQRWWISDPANPDREPVEVAYPRAGTDNAEVTLHALGLDGGRVEVEWDRAALPYLIDVSWSTDGPPLLSVMSRDQRRLEVRTIEPSSGSTELRWSDTDEAWVDISTPGVPAWLPDGRLLTVRDRDGARRLEVDGEPITPVGLQVRAVVHSGPEGLVITGSAADPAEVHVHHVRLDGTGEELTTAPGVHSAAVGGSTVVLSSAGPDFFGGRYTVYNGQSTWDIQSLAATPPLTPHPALLWVGERRLRTALLLPTGHVAGTKLPVLLDPYGGPHHQEVVAARGAYLDSQWLADQGFAVVVTDGRGTPGRGPEWERAVKGDLATAPLEDQVDALHAVAADNADLDLSRVAIRGWSFGGFLAALGVMRRPDVFRAAIAGAPVTDMSLYDTFYTERYLGTEPFGADADAYRRSSIIDDAPKLERELLIIHGLADDNVVVAHTLRLSSALLTGGRPHAVLPLSGVTHMTPQEVVAENLQLLQLDFLRRALA